jgi:hypothetical protein
MMKILLMKLLHEMQRGDPVSRFAPLASSPVVLPPQLLHAMVHGYAR